MIKTVVTAGLVITVRWQEAEEDKKTFSRELQESILQNCYTSKKTRDTIKNTRGKWRKTGENGKEICFQDITRI